MPELAPAGAAASVTRFTYGGAALVAEEFGAGTTTFLLIHGIGMGRSVFADLAVRLRDRGRIVAVDLPGYGEAPEPSRTLTMERTADLVAAFLRARAIGPVVVIGHSMGTQVAAELAARHPGLVAGIVLVAPTVNIRERRGSLQLLRLAQDLAVESPRVIVVGTREYLRAGPHLRRKLHAMIAHRPEQAYPRIEAPALVLRGAHDYVSPRDWCRSVTHAIRRARMHEIDGHGHETMIRDAAPAAARIIAFTGV